ncbi:MAG: hypothetical protein ACTSW1_03480 [Candidatus Hodarchaeales archaeon]
MKKRTSESSITELFKSAAKLASQRKSWGYFGYKYNPCEPLLPVTLPETFYGEDILPVKQLIANLISFITNSSLDLLFLKGPIGSGKNIFAHIFVKYSLQLGINAIYIDAADLLSNTTSVSWYEQGDVIFLDNAFHLRETLRKISSLNSAEKSSPKIVALMSSSEFESYRRHSIRVGDNTYRHFLPMYHFSDYDITELLSRRLKACLDGSTLPEVYTTLISDIASLSLGNPGVALHILDEAIKFATSLNDIRISFGIRPQSIKDLPTSKLPLIRELLVSEVLNGCLPWDKRKYLIHKDFTSLLNRTKGTISHHLSDLISRNLIYESATTRDRREKAYRPNQSILGILEYYAFEMPFNKDSLIKFNLTREII